MDETLDSAQAWSQLLAAEPSENDFLDTRAAELVHLLNRRGEPEVVDWALPLLTDPDPWRRYVAAWLLGQHGFREGRPFGARVTPAIVRAARTEDDDETRSMMVQAIGHAEDPQWVDDLLAFAADRYPSVRQAVASSLPLMFGADEMSDAALDALIGLSADVDPEVRDWATMSLGTQTERDGDAIRAALRARLDDDGEEGATSAEAAVGLARRGDVSVYPYLERWLAEPDVGDMVIEAAGALGDVRLLPALNALRDAGWHLDDPRPEVLTEAITSLESNA